MPVVPIILLVSNLTSADPACKSNSILPFVQNRNLSLHNVRLAVFIRVDPAFKGNLCHCSTIKPGSPGIPSFGSPVHLRLSRVCDEQQSYGLLINADLLQLHLVNLQFLCE